MRALLCSAFMAFASKKKVYSDRNRTRILSYTSPPRYPILQLVFLIQFATEHLLRQYFCLLFRLYMNNHNERFKDANYQLSCRSLKLSRSTNYIWVHKFEYSSRFDRILILQSEPSSGKISQMGELPGHILASIAHLKLLQ